MRFNKNLIWFNAGEIAYAESVIIATRFRKSFMHLYKKMNDLSDGIETLVHEVAPESETEDYNNVRENPFRWNRLWDESN